MNGGHEYSMRGRCSWPLRPNWPNHGGHAICGKIWSELGLRPFMNNVVGIGLKNQKPNYKYWSQMWGRRRPDSCGGGWSFHGLGNTAKKWIEGSSLCVA